MLRAILLRGKLVIQIHFSCKQGRSGLTISTDRTIFQEEKKKPHRDRENLQIRLHQTKDV